MYPRCTKPKKLSVPRSWRPTKRRKLPSQAKSRTIFQRLLQRRSLHPSWVFSFLSTSPGAGRSPQRLGTLTPRRASRFALFCETFTEYTPRVHTSCLLFSGVRFTKEVRRLRYVTLGMRRGIWLMCC
jgi:hypothetical protein